MPGVLAHRRVAAAGEKLMTHSIVHLISEWSESIIEPSEAFHSFFSRCVYYGVVLLKAYKRSFSECFFIKNKFMRMKASFRLLTLARCEGKGGENK
jgi:hypothetical protein